MHSVQEIYTCCKCFGYRTEVMGASLRNVGQILELPGFDLLTISCELMKQLFQSITRRAKADSRKGEKSWVKRLELDEKKLRSLLNEDTIATEKPAEGIRKFAPDIAKLREAPSPEDNG